jgi:hypothetical protein
MTKPLRALFASVLAATTVSAYSADLGTVFKPEQLVQFPQSNVACFTKDDLSEVMDHFFKGEATKANAMFLSPQRPDGRCIMLSIKKKYKVIAVEYNDPAQPTLGLLELVGAGNNSGTGVWVLSMMAQPAK